VVLKEFQERAPVDNQTPCPNVENVKFDEMHQRLLAALDQFTGFVYYVFFPVKYRSSLCMSKQNLMDFSANHNFC
jgi:hypothetical protein